MRAILLFFLLVFSVSPAFGQDTVRVINAVTGDPLVNAEFTFFRNGDQLEVPVNPYREGYYVFHINPHPDSLWIRGDGFKSVSIELRSPGDMPRALGLSPITLVRLPALKISAYESGRTIDEVAAAVVTILPLEVQRFDNTSIQSVINTVPGVRMESRGSGGSRRISIRGSTLRSPFGVRNIKAYINGAPISSPDGSTPLELMDVDQLSSMEIIKGPASSLYGAGTGGALLFRSEPEIHQHQVGFTGLVGSDGLYRGTLELSQGKGDLRTRINYTRHRYDGYREQEHVQKDQLTWFVEKTLSEKRKAALFGTLYCGEWGLPGSLNEEDAADKPRQAVDFSVEGDARVYRFRQWLALSHSYRFHESFSNFTVVTLNSTTKENPFGTSPFFNGYKEEAASGVGIRSVFKWKPQSFNQKLTVVWGMEAQTESNELDQFTNEQGSPGEPTILTTTRSTEAFAFAQADWKFAEHWMGTLGSSVNLLHFDHTDRLVDGVDQSGSRLFDPVVSPRLSLFRKWRNNTFYGQLSFGFSPPTVWDILQADGSINTQLQPEIGRNAELGWRGFYGFDRLVTDVSVFYQVVNQSIVPEGLPDGSTVFRNAGQTEQMGLEAKISAQLLELNGWPGWGLSPWLSLTLHDFTFRDYVVEGEDFSGNPMTGVPREAIQTGIDFRQPWGTYLRPTLAYTGAIPLNDANTEESQASTVINLRVGWHNLMTRTSSTQWDVFAGINNVMDEQYTSFFQWNAFGGRYFNPAPGRIFYFGLRLIPKWPVRPIQSKKS